MEHTETLAAMACGCSIIERQQIAGLSPTYHTIEYCPLHKAAPMMYEACDSVAKWLNSLIATGYAEHPLYLPMKLALELAPARAVNK